MYLILGRPNCPYCDEAKELLTIWGKAYHYVDVLLPENKGFLSLLKDNNYNTVPQVFKLQEGGHESLLVNLTEEALDD